MKRHYRISLMIVLILAMILLNAAPVFAQPKPKHQSDEPFVALALESVGPPANDLFVDRITLTGPSGSTTGSNIEATIESGEPDAFGEEHSVWWTWTAPSTDTYAFDSAGSDINTVVVVYTGSSVDALTVVAGNDDSTYTDTAYIAEGRAVFKATADTRYNISVSSAVNETSTGNVALAWSAVTPPTNDDFSAATAITTASGQLFSDNSNATREADELNIKSSDGECYTLGIASVWWKFTAPATSRYAFDTYGSALQDTTLVVYTGSSLGTLDWVTGNDDTPESITSRFHSKVEFETDEGTDYYICADGYYGLRGSITLNWSNSIAPVFTSLAVTTFTADASSSFTITTTGAPDPVISQTTGSLPAGISFVDNTDGTATLSGTPAAGSGGTYPLTFSASNGVSPDATQNYTLTVNELPVITNANSVSFATGSYNSFSVTASGYPKPALSQTGTLPSGVSFVDNGNGTATLSGTAAAGTGGPYPLVITAANGVGANGTQNLTLTVNEAPVITLQPVKQTVLKGTSATFTVAFNAYPSADTQWQVSTNNGKTWTDVGTNSLTYTTPATTRLMNRDLYRAVISNGIGLPILSDSALLIIKNK